MEEVKLYISQAIDGLADDIAEKKRNKCFESAVAFLAHNKYISKDAKAVIANDLSEDTQSGENPIWCLGESIKKMAEADFVVFAVGWRDSTSCVVEHEVARMYGTQLLGVYEPSLDEFVVYAMKLGDCIEKE